MNFICIRGIVAVVFSFFASCLIAQRPLIPAEQIEFFESRIRPVLIEQCYECHNSSDNADAGLSVDYRDALLKGGASGDVLVPGNAKKSRLIAVLKHDIEGVEMPEGGARLNDAVIGDFEKWIEMGAPDPRDEPPSSSELAALTSWEATRERRKQWWSFQAIQDLTPPSGDAGHPIDRFVDAKLFDAGLQRGLPAENATLIRRLFVALIGLPPNPRQFARWSANFETDKQQAVSDLVDELLANPHFGERWARHWMDWIRYAESHGSEGDPRIDNAYRYRDYLIRAWNDDVPYDQLVREHVAGDLLETPRINEAMGINESVVGTVHWRMVFHGFAPTDVLDEKVRFVDDQINVFSKAFLGLTVSCARCHDHKFDAISQADYYALFGILSSCRPARQVIDLPEQQNLNRQSLSDLKPQIKAAIIRNWRSSGLRDLASFLQEPQFESAELKDPLVAELVKAKGAVEGIIQRDWASKAEQFQLTTENANTDTHWDFTRGSDVRQWYRHGIGLDNPAPSTAGEFAIAVEGDRVLQGIYPAGIFSHQISTKHPARLTSQDHLIEPGQQLWVRAFGGGDAALRYVVQDYPRNGTVFPIRTLTPEWKWQRFDLSYWSGDSMHVELVTAQDAPLLVKDKARSWFGVSDVVVTTRKTPPVSHDEALRAVLAIDAKPNSYDDLVSVYVQAIEDSIVAWEAGKLGNDQAFLLDRCLQLGWLPNRISQLPDVSALRTQYRKLESEIPVPVRVPGLDETVGREQPLFIRGNHKEPGDLVPRRYLEAFDATPYETSQSGRLELADDLLDESNPLTRRVIVNRLWHHLFGRGLVETADNFGQLGAKPSHPELLDWLAVRLVEEKWSLKKMIRLMVTSKAWQQSSRPSDDARRLDPANRLLSHANVRRMEAEVIRDSLLMVAERLDDLAMFGPPVDGNANRRSIYVRVIRNSLDPFLRAFDFPEPFSTTGRRDDTNIPAQSLTMMNATQVGQVASDLAKDLLSDSSLNSDGKRIEQLFVRLFSRSPTETEKKLYLDHLGATRAQVIGEVKRSAELKQELKQQRGLAQRILGPIRQRLIEDPSARVSVAVEPPRPLARWSFDEDLSDSLGALNGIGQGAARIEDGALVVQSGGYVTTGVLPKTLTEKTLEAWVRLDDLQQRGGGVVTVQAKDGGEFDSIVFGEAVAGHWMAGSDHLRRTRPFFGASEDSADERYVHVAIVYHSDGRVVGYREGEPYGKSYASNGPNRFQAGDAIVSFGVRHLPATGNRLLAGKIDEARLYDRALSEAEVAASFAHGSHSVTREQLWAAMSGNQRAELQKIEARIEVLETELGSLGAVARRSSELVAWIDVAHASLMMKEFIYVR
ncbi:MAG: DUF1553 domain-containing protein [Rubripirellula sp.]|nr:DUF1553 domain-containing protein [Rubripirellula sp.]